MTKIVFGFVLVLMLGASPSGKVRGRAPEYFRSHRLLVTYTKNHYQQAKDAVTDTRYFHVVTHERKLNSLRCRFGGNDRLELAAMLDRLSESPAVQLIEPDPNK